MKYPLSATLSGLLALGGCAAPSAQIPSLAPRAIEKTSTAEPAVAPPPVMLPPDAATEAQLTALAKRLDAGEADFAQRLAGATAAVDRAKSATPGSESWVVAQQQLTALEGAAGEAAAVQSALDALYLDRLTSVAGGGSTAGLEAIRALQAQAAAVVDPQRRQLDSLKAVVRPR